MTAARDLVTLMRNYNGEYLFPKFPTVPEDHTAVEAVLRVANIATVVKIRPDNVERLGTELVADED